MGDYTKYKIKVFPQNRTEEVFSQFAKIQREYWDFLLIDRLDSNGGFGESFKWYEHEDDCKSVSSSLPDTVICLYGEGDFWVDDRWRKDFFNGAIVDRWEMEADPFDENKPIPDPKQELIDRVGQ